MPRIGVTNTQMLTGSKEFPCSCQKYRHDRATMKTLADYHTHTKLCGHAEGSTIDYVNAAHACGLEEMGFACHSPMSASFDDWRMKREDLPTYLEMVERARIHGACLGVTVRLGLEVDYLPGHENWIEELSTFADWDYLIGSVHYLTDDLVVDHPDHQESLKAMAVEELWQRYWDRYTQAIATGFFDFMGHPDLPKKFGVIPEGSLTNYYQNALSAMVEAECAYEINTAGLRKPIGEMYPAPEFLRAAFEMRIPLVISSDAHRPEDVGADFEAATALAKSAGYTQTVHFHHRERGLLDFD